MMAGTITVVVPKGLLMSLNDRKHWRATLDTKAALRQLGVLAGRAARLEFDRARLTVLFHWPDRRIRDRHNYFPTIKHVLDGIVDAGVLPDDSDKYLDGPIPKTAPYGQCPPGQAVQLDFHFEAI